MSDELRDRQQAIALGEKAIAFLNGDLGSYIIARAEKEEREALEALATVDANDPPAIRDLQAQVWRANSFLAWLQEILHAAELEATDLSGAERLPEGGDP